MPKILWPDVTSTVIGYLKPLLDPAVFVGNTLPTTRPNKAVIVRDDGGPQIGDVRAVSRIGYNVWADTDADVADLTAIVEAHLAGMGEANTTPVVKSAVTRSYPVADDSGQPLRSGSAELWLRGTSL